MIEQQLNKIRKVAKRVYLAADKEVADDIASTLNQAADTIEALSVNPEANDGEWINDEKPKESGHYFITTDTVLMGEVDSDVGYWDGECWNTFSNVYAWKPINFPKPYRP